MVNDYTIYDEIGRASNDRAFRSLYRTRSSHIFSQCLRLISDEYMLEVNKHVRWLQLSVNATDHRCVIGILSIFDTLFRYLPIFLTVLQYWVPPNVPVREYHKSSIRPPSLISHPLPSILILHKQLTCTDQLWFIQAGNSCCFWSPAAWPPTSCAQLFQLYALVLCGELLPFSHC